MLPSSLSGVLQGASWLVEDSSGSCALPGEKVILLLLPPLIFAPTVLAGIFRCFDMSL